jgi:beta-lactam-binding protein with PASTA domain
MGLLYQPPWAAGRLVLCAFALLAGCSADEEHTTVPSNATFSLGIAMERLLAAGLRVEIEAFPPQPAGVGLERYFVAVQSPRAPARVPRGSTVAVRVTSSLIPSPSFPTKHPPTVVVPALVGLHYSDAIARLPEGTRLALRRVPPLTPEASVNGFDAYRVARQDPAPGTVLPYGCPTAPGGGCLPSTIRLELELADR